MRRVWRWAGRVHHQQMFGCTVIMVWAAMLAAAPARARELNLTHQWSAETDARDAAARVFTAELKRLLPATQITIHAKSKLIANPVEQYEALLDGRADMAIYPLFYLSPKMPEISISLMPGVPASVEQAQLLRGSDFEAKFQLYCAQKGFRVLAWLWLAGGIVSRAPEVGLPKSYNGLNVRSGDPNFDLMFQAAGAKSHVMPSTEIVRSLKDGRIDVALTSYESLVSMKIFEQTKHALLGGDSLFVSLQPLIISTKVWDELSDPEKLAFEDAALAAETAFNRTQIEAERSVVDTFTKAGAKVRQMTNDEYEGWLYVANDTSWRTYRNLNGTTRVLFDAMLQSFIDSKPK
jgi:TRAP-type transport system periplasmic protein